MPLAATQAIHSVASDPPLPDTIQGLVRYQDKTRLEGFRLPVIYLKHARIFILWLPLNFPLPFTYNLHSILPLPSANMPVTITVLFPNDPDAKYDYDYYINKHLPLVQRLWSKYGVTGFSATKFTTGPDGSEPKYAFGSVVYWTSHDQIKAAFAGPEVGQIFEDNPNFSNKDGVFMFGDASE